MRKLLIFLLAFSLPLHAVAMEICTEIPTTIEISDLYPAPLDGESEWVELTNTGTDQIDLSYFTLEDTTQKPMSLSSTLDPDSSTQITDLSFQLNNGGDTVILRTIDGTEIDSLSYEESTSGQSLLVGGEEEAVELTSSTTTEYPIFSEALPNPEGTDSTAEWIELYNPYDYPLTLDGLQLDDSEGGSSAYSLEGNIEATSYLLIYSEDSNLTLNNSTDSVRLLNTDEVIWEISYDDPEEGESYALIGSTYQWTNNPTPGSANLASTSTEESESEYQDGDLSEEVEVTEVYPNPEGADAEEEWIEITNGGDTAVNLGNWTVDDGEGGSDPYVFPDDTIIGPGETIVLYRTESGVALNNSDEVVELVDYTGEVVDEVSYEDSVEGQSYAEIEVEEMASDLASTSDMGTRIFSTWKWSSPSPGEHNPRWQQFKGEVLSFENGMLSLFNGISTWNFNVDNNFIDDFLFQAGNSVLIQAAMDGDIFQVMHSELLESADPADNRNLPFGLIGTALLAAGWISYELYKKRKENLTPTTLQA